jgi:SP family xylose:H+ symportor-like MFS transporter
VNLVFTLLAMWQVDRLGGPLMLIGALGLSISFIVLAVSIAIACPVILISAFVLLAIGIYAFSLAPVTWVLISEFSKQGTRRSINLAVVSLWVAFFILVFTFPILAEKIGTYGPFYLYAGICFPRLPVCEI